MNWKKARDATAIIRLNSYYVLGYIVTWIFGDTKGNVLKLVQRKRLLL